ncbi:MAG: prepilin-type N-terminal cleavage/methylation domain-containing protein [Candidatus Kryptoniota bacterium]
MKKDYTPLRIPNKNPGGFTLIELIIVIVIVIIITGIGVPSLTHLIASSRLQEVAWQMVQDLKTAKESTILYQQDLNVYLDYGNSPIDPLSPSNLSCRRYFYETFLQDPLNDKHYIPSDSPNSKFFLREMKYGIVIDNISSNPSDLVTLDEKKFFIITFRSGSGNSFRGEANITTSILNGKNSTTSKVNSSSITIKLKDVNGNYFYVIVNAAGKITMSGKP